MLISQALAKQIVEELQERFKVAPNINEQGIREISFKFMEPLLELLETTLEDLKNSKVILGELLDLLSSSFPNEVVSLEIGLGPDACPDKFLQKSIIQILEKHILDPKLLQSTFKIIYPVMYQLLHEYRYNKNPNRPDIDDINSLMLFLQQPMIQKFKKLSAKIGQNNSEPKDTEIELTVLKCFKNKKLKIVNDEASTQTIEEKFIMASGYGFFDMMAWLIKERKVNVNAIVDGKFALAAACYNGDMPAVQLLLENHANITTVGLGGETALCFACESGQSAIVKLLLGHKDIGRMIDQAEAHGMTPLMIASAKGFIDIVQILLSKNANIESKGFDDTTALYLACQEGHKGIVELLLTHQKIGNILNHPRDNGYTPLLVTVEEDFFEIAEMLLKQNANIEQKNKGGATVLYIACQYKREAIVKLLMSHKDIGKIIDQAIDEGYTPLMIAAVNNFVDIVDMLQSKGANIELKTKNGANVLYCACQYGRQAMVKLLLNHKDIGKIIDQAIDEGYTPLMIAAEKGFLDIVKMLLSKNANIEQRNKNGETVFSLIEKFKSSILTFSYNPNANNTDTSDLKPSSLGVEKNKF